MDQLLLIREDIVFFYKRYETFISYVLRFIMGLIIINFINTIGHYNEMFEPLYIGPMSFPFLMLLAILFMILPPTVANLLIVLNVVIQISTSLEVAFFVLLLLSIVLVFYSRLAPKKSLLIIAMILGFYFRIPYAVVLFAGLYCGLTSIIPVIIGTYIWGLIPLFSDLVSKAVVFDVNNIDIMEIFNNMLETYKLIFEGFAGSFDSLFSAFVYAMIILAVYAVSRLTIDYSKEIAVGIGALVGVLGFIIGIIITKTSYSILDVFLFSLLSVAIVECIRFFDIVLDYKKAERVEFEDDDNYYYVKVIPKIIMRKLEPAPSPPSKYDHLPKKVQRESLPDLRRGERAESREVHKESKPPLRTFKPNDEVTVKPLSKSYLELANLTELSKRVDMQQEALKREREQKMRESADDVKE